MRQMSYVRNFHISVIFFFMAQGFKKKKQSAYKPSSVPYINKVSVIYLSDVSPRHFSGLPSDMERATLITPVYMTLQLLRRTARMSPCDWWALTPPSHPYPVSRRNCGGCFLLRYSTFADSFLLGSRMLCVARTFLFRLAASAADRPAAFKFTKIAILG